MIPYLTKTLGLLHFDNLVTAVVDVGEATLAEPGRRREGRLDVGILGLLMRRLGGAERVSGGQPGGGRV